MVKIRNVFGDRYSGQQGQAGVYANWKGIQYRRSYVIPANPRTTKQQTIRGYFAAAVDEFHNWLTYAKQAYNYLAATLRMSGYNLWVSRYVASQAAGLPAPTRPRYGLKQFGTSKTTVTDEALPGTGKGPHTLDHKPIVVKSLKGYSPAGGNPAMGAYVDIDRGLVRIVTNITNKLVIAYTAGGRVVDYELLDSDGVTASEASPAQYEVTFWPIDLGSVKIYDTTATQAEDLDAADQIESMEIDLRNGKVYIDKTSPDAAGTVDYEYYVGLGDVRMLVTKADTSFKTWLGYSDNDGFLFLAQTIEDENYDVTMEKGGYQTIIWANRACSKVTEDEFILMTAV